MKKLLPLTLILTILSSAIKAEETQTITVTTTGGKTYSNVTLSRVEPDGLVVMTDDGIEKLPFTILPDDLQAKYGYDPEAANNYQRASHEVIRKQQAEREAQRQQRATSKALNDAAKQISGTVLSVTKDGVLLTDVGVMVNETVNVVVDRNLLNGNPWYEQRTRQRRVSTDGMVFIYGVKGMVDGRWFDKKVYPAPIYTYRSLNGVQRTVSGYAISEELSQKLLLLQQALEK